MERIGNVIQDKGFPPTDKKKGNLDMNSIKFDGLPTLLET